MVHTTEWLSVGLSRNIPWSLNCGPSLLQIQMISFNMGAIPRLLKKDHMFIRQLLVYFTVWLPILKLSIIYFTLYALYWALQPIHLDTCNNCLGSASIRLNRYEICKEMTQFIGSIEREWKWISCEIILVCCFVISIITSIAKMSHVRAVVWMIESPYRIFCSRLVSF